MFVFHRRNCLAVGSKTWHCKSPCILLQQISLITFDAAVTAEKLKPRSKKTGPVPFVPPLTIAADLKPSVPVWKPFDAAAAAAKQELLRSKKKGPVSQPPIKKRIIIASDLKPSVPVWKPFDAAAAAAKQELLRSKKKGTVSQLLIKEKITIVDDLEPLVPARKWIPKPKEMTPAEKAEVKIGELLLPAFCIVGTLH